MFFPRQLYSGLGEITGGRFGDDGIFYFMHFFLECSLSCHYLHLLKSKPLFNVLTAASLYLWSNKRVTFAERSLLDLEVHLTSPHSCDIHVIYHLSSVNHEMRWRGLGQTDSALLEVTKLVSGRAGTRSPSLTSKLVEPQVP